MWTVTGVALLVIGLDDLMSVGCELGELLCGLV